jgi:hypothetical protein
MQRRSWVFALALALGCDSAAGPSDLTGTIVDTHLTERGEEPWPFGPDDVELAAVVPEADGTWTTIAGMVDRMGTFRVPQVPGGDYYLRMRKAGFDSWPVFIHASARTFDLGALYLGRPDAEEPTGPTPLTVNATGLAAWETSLRLGLFSLGAGSADHDLDEAAVTLPAPGATTLQGFTIDVSLLSRPGLVDGSVGDTLFLTQHTVLKHNGLPYWSLVRALQADSFSQADGEPVAISGTFLPAKVDRQLVSWDLGSLARATKDVNPSASEGIHGLLFYADPAGPRRTSSSPSPLLMSTGIDGQKSPNSDFPFNLAFGNPYQPVVEVSTSPPGGRQGT